MIAGDEPATPGVRALGAGSQAEHGEGEQEELKQGPWGNKHDGQSQVIQTLYNVLLKVSKIMNLWNETNVIWIENKNKKAM